MDSPSNRRLIYQYEILRARLGIREHYLTTIVKDIYENIGQVLGLVRIQLSVLELGLHNDKKEKVNSSGKLVGTVMKDLLNIRYKFQPEDNIITDRGFNESIKHELQSVNPAALFLAEPKTGIPKTLGQGKALILFNIVLEILSLIREDKGRQVPGLEIHGNDKKVEFVISIKGNRIDRKSIGHTGSELNLSISQRVKFLGGTLQVRSKDDKQQIIKLVIPNNKLLWEK